MGSRTDAAAEVAKYVGNKRVVMRKILCENANADDPVIEDDIDENVKSEEDVVQEGEEAAQTKRLPRKKRSPQRTLRLRRNGKPQRERLLKMKRLQLMRKLNQPRNLPKKTLPKAKRMPTPMLHNKRCAYLDA
ncbi:hypothetical protein DL767_009844 [Monosporascus sp. MG133]|nr:hypothetical protein DL767_009844 [Monosporascus sp. MG133]